MVSKRIVIWHNKFKKDCKRAQKRGLNMKKLEDIMHQLENGIPLEASKREHKLTGNYEDYLECHIEPDWLLIYQRTPTHIILLRTGSHADLF